MTDENTRKLIRLYRKTGSRKALEVLIVNHQNTIRYTIQNSVPLQTYFNNYATADEVDDFIQFGNELLYNIIQTFDLRKKLKFNTYFIQIFKFRIIDRLRVSKEKLHERPIVGNPDDFTDEDQLDYKALHRGEQSVSGEFQFIEESDVEEILNRYIRELQMIDQAILLNKYYGGRHEDIADQLGISVSRVSQRYVGALSTLKQQLLEDKDYDALFD